MRDQVPQTRIEPLPPALDTQLLTNWITKEVPLLAFIVNPSSPLVGGDTVFSKDGYNRVPAHDALLNVISPLPHGKVVISVPLNLGVTLTL